MTHVHSLISVTFRGKNQPSVLATIKSPSNNGSHCMIVFHAEVILREAAVNKH